MLVDGFVSIPPFVAKVRGFFFCLLFRCVGVEVIKNFFPQKLYHLGFRSDVSLPTLAHANEKRDWRVYRKLAEILTKKTRKFYVGDPNIASDIEGACYAIDSTSIELCLSFFRWAPYVSTKGAVKLHLVLDMRGSTPVFFDMTRGKVNDVNFLDSVSFERD